MRHIPATPGVTIKDEGNNVIGAASSVNFKGSGVTATNAGGGQADVTVAGGGGGSSAWGDITGTLADQTDLQAALDAKAALAGPTFTGTPAAPTASLGTSTTQLATTAFVQQEILSKEYVDGEVDAYADLPITVGTPAIGVVYIVKSWSIANPFSFPGLWERTGNSGALSDWIRLGNQADMFADAYLRIYDEGDSTKRIAFSAGGITAGQTRVLTPQDKSYTLADKADLDTHVANTSNPHSVTQTQVGLSNVTNDAQLKAADLDIDGTLAANSDTKIASQKATKTYADTKTTAAAALAAAAGIKLDDFAAPDDNTDLNASTTAHGLAPKVTAAAAGNRNVHAVDNGETVRKDTALFDTTNPASLGTAAPGTSLIAARRDHVHPIAGLPEVIIIACGDETTQSTTGTAKVTFRMPFAMTLTAVRASVTGAPTGSGMTFDINEGGTTVLSTKLTIDATQKTSTTAGTPPVISDSSLADDAEMTIDFDAVGSTLGGAGVKIELIGTRT